MGPLGERRELPQWGLVLTTIVVHFYLERTHLMATNFAFFNFCNTHKFHLDGFGGGACSAGAGELESPPGASERPLPRGPREVPKQAPPPPPLRGLRVVFGRRLQ